MGYHVGIIRSAAGNKLPIAAPEVRAALGKMDGLLAAQEEGGEMRLVFPELGDDSEIVVCEDDELWASNPSERLLGAMIVLAGHLGARVRGDELETYRSLDDWYTHPDDQALHDEAMAAQAARRRTADVRRRRALAVKWGLLALAVAALARRVLGGG